MGFFTKKHSNKPNKIYLDLVKIIITVAAGMYVLIDIRYLHPDPQGPIAILIVPVLQLIIYSFLCLMIMIVAWIFNKPTKQ
jgi:hypothetical protein